MRLLDQVAHCSKPVLLALKGGAGRPVEVNGPSRFAARVAQCPLRFVLADDLTRASAELAFADGARLEGCLDLLRMPSQHLWIEWNDAVYKRVVYETQSSPEFDTRSAGRKVGVLLESAADGLSATARTFWSEPSEGDCVEVAMSPLETHIDLRGEFAAVETGDSLTGALAHVTDRGDAALTSLLCHVRFRFEESWRVYYNAAVLTTESRHRVVVGSIEAVARDAPFLLAFLLLLTAKDATRSIPISRSAVNKKRCTHGHAPLLDHIEVHASLDGLDLKESADQDSLSLNRQSPRLHHVRGHLVRRDQRVFWRVPHLRGSGCRGMVRSRTVCLSFARAKDSEARVS
jgi:hypothetical protein